MENLNNHATIGNAMPLKEQVSELYGRFEAFNDRNLTKVTLPGGFRWDISGRLVSGLIGFALFVSLLGYSFATADVEVSPLGGAKVFEGQVTLEPTQVLSDARVVSEGDVVDYIPTDESANRRILKYELQFTWSNVDTDVGAPDVQLEVWSSNESREMLVFTDTAFDGGFQVDWVINNNTLLENETFTTSADSEAQIIDMLERDGEAIFARATYVDDNNPSPIHPAERLEFRMTITLVTWDVELEELKIN